MRVFHCDHCRALLFFENVVCVSCGRALAYVPELRKVTSLDHAPSATTPNRWTSPVSGRAFRLCENYTKHSVCNWAVPDDDPSTLCRSCTLTRTIPNLGKPGNDRLWFKLEVAKRRLVYTLLELGLPIEDRVQDPAHGLAFDLLEDAEDGTAVMTGHVDGIITVNVAEADDAERVKRRVALNEPYRTLLGHFRHESGHYYWSRLVERDAAMLEGFRERFGDERVDYQCALQKHYAEGAPPGWRDAFISAYAAMHPWEDFAETWAHYLHMADTLETAAACGIKIDPPRSDEPTLHEVPHPLVEGKVPFKRLMDSWTTITYVMNNLNRGLGNDDAYPFVLSHAAMAKLGFVHDLVSR